MDCNASLTRLHPAAGSAGLVPAAGPRYHQHL